MRPLVPTSSRCTMPGPLGGAGGRDPEPGTGECTEDRWTLPSDGRMGRDTGGLVDHDDVVVVVDDPEVGARRSG